MLLPREAVAGWGFDTAFTPEELVALVPAAPRNSWLRVRDMERAPVLNDADVQVDPWPGMMPSVTIAQRRAALAGLRAKGYRLVAFLRWPSESWPRGVRAGDPFRRLPRDLREAYERTQGLARTYGDLVDYWEIDNEPDISFVEENPETYAAFLKACALGLRSGNRQWNGASASHNALMAPLALPPGPYFTAFAANDGLRYTTGLNYHYYGYAEDFAGVYEQFRDATALAPHDERSPRETVFSTQFYPATRHRKMATLATFAHSADAAAENFRVLESRPLAGEEPVLHKQGRWLASPGVTVEETSEGWRFHVTSWAPGPLRPAMAELPLPEHWQMPADSFLLFEYRLEANAPDTVATDHVSGPPLTRSESESVSRGGIAYPQPVTKRSNSALPVFLTEYGYGLLDRAARKTPEGRERQRAWFVAVQTQLRQLGVDAAMAFLLRPYLEADNQEFGLLMDSASGRVQAKTPRMGNYAVSPALAALLSETPSPRGPIDISEKASVIPAALSAVLIDFLAAKNLVQAKNYDGYLIRPEEASTAAAEGNVVIYNFGTDPTSGTVALEGCWEFSEGSRTKSVTLEPNECLMLPVTIVVNDDHFAAQRATATFGTEKASPRARSKPEARATSPLRYASVAAELRPIENLSPAKRISSGSSSPAVVRSASFEPYIRTKNGNLYQSWPRLTATENWQRYIERAGNLTMAFFGRAHLPWQFKRNEPASLVFFFRPEKLPATFEIRQARLVKLVPAD